MAQSINPEFTGRADEWLSEADLKRLGSADVRLAYLKYFGNVALYLSSLVLALSNLGPAANLIGAVLNGVSLAVFFIIGHDCVHHAFFASRLANEIWGRVAYGLCWHSVSLWRIVHNVNHHTKTNLKSVDDVWRPFSPQEFQALSAWRRLLERAFRHPTGHLIYYQLAFLFPKLIFPLNGQTRPHWKKHLPDTLFVLVFGAAILTGVFFLGDALDPQSSAAERSLFGAIIPFVLWNALTSFTIYIQHTHPSVHWFSDERRWSFYRGQIEGTTDVIIGLRAIPLYAEVLRHSAHHSFPKIPVYKLPEAQEKLVAHYGSAVTQWNLGLKAFLDVHRRCKLYDYEAQRWTDFEGRPTSASWFDRRDADGNPFRRQIKGASAGADSASAA